jgi:acetyl esterase
MALYPQSRRAIEGYALDVPDGDPTEYIAAARTEALTVAAQVSREAVDQVVEVDADGVRCRLYVPDGARAVIVVLFSTTSTYTTPLLVGWRTDLGWRF